MNNRKEVLKIRKTIMNPTDKKRKAKVRDRPKK
jgi:hypothetical protein